MKWLWKLLKNKILDEIDVEVKVDVPNLSIHVRVEIFGDVLIDRVLDLDGPDDNPDTPGPTIKANKVQ